MNFADQDIVRLVAALPARTDPRRRRLLPLILAEWGATELDEHLTRTTPAQIRIERRQMTQVAASAGALAQALHRLNSDSAFAIATHLALPASRGKFDAPPHQQTVKVLRSLTDQSASLRNLARAATDAAAKWTPIPLRHSTLVRYLVLQDLAAIFEWATGQRAGRRVRTDLSEKDPRKPYGPFWEFALVAWPIVFGSTKGLDNSFKTWALGRRKFRESSPVIANIAFSHPEWRIRKE